MTELQNLENRVKELENKLKEYQKSTALFGRSYSQIGNSNSDFLIKTKGQVKIQWGSKFIDLIKDGKVNVESSFIFKVKDNIGVKDGIYILDNGSIYLKSGDSIISLIGESGNTYVSFMNEQKTDSESKHTALTNIGFLYSDIDQIDSNSLQNGIIYVESEQKLYIVQNGILTEFTIDFPNPYTQQFVVAKNNQSKGSIYIKGSGINNSLAFDQLYIYNEYNNSYISSEGDIIFKILDNDKIKITNNLVEFIQNEIVGKMFKSSGATQNNGFRLYINNGESTLEVDNIIVRNQNNSENNSEFIHPEYWYYNTNIISRIDLYEDPEEQSASIKYQINLKYKNTYTIGERIYIYAQIEEQINEVTSYKLQKIPLIVDSVIDNSIIAYVYENFETDIVLSTKGNTIFSIGNKESIKILKRNSDNLDIIELNKVTEDQEGIEEVNNFDDEQNIESVITRVGKISDLKLSINTNGHPELYNNDYGIFSNDGIFLRAAYKSDYQLEENDNSSRFASTEWVNKILENQSEDITSSFMKDINMNISQYPFETKDIPNYLNNVDIQNLAMEQEDNTTRGYICNFGILTISKQGYITIYAALVRSKLKDGTYSYRTINAYQTNDSYTSLSTYLIQPQFNPGYYWSDSKNGNIPVSPTYIGTTCEGFTISESQKYLWYTNDGDTWILKGQYVAPDPSKLYILSTACSSYSDISNIPHRSPAGFICCYKNGSIVDCGFGQSNYVPVSYTSTINLSKLTTLLSDAQSGVVPQRDGYLYLWSIDSAADRTVGDNWKEETSLSTGAGLELVINNADWGNQSSRPGWTMWEINSSNEVIGSPDSSVYINGDGDASNWNNEIWRTSFLREILSSFLQANEASRYNPITGWYMNYEGDIFCSGFGGVFTARIGSIKDPTSDNPNDIGYKPTCILTQLSGYAIGNGYKADFIFKNVKLGEKYNNLAAGLIGLSTGQIINSQNKKYFKVSYESFSVNLKSLEDSAVNVE